MRKIVYLIATALDGFIALEPNRDPDFFRFKGTHVPDLLRKFPEMIPAHACPPWGWIRRRRTNDSIQR